VHISTISRAIRGKFAQTPQGILALKAFFSGGQATSRGGQRSRVAIHERIKDIVDAEDRRSPLSDEEIARVLRERDGIKVARRTVTKYRKAMDIPSSTMRKAFWPLGGTTAAFGLWYAPISPSADAKRKSKSSP